MCDFFFYSFDRSSRVLSSQISDLVRDAALYVEWMRWRVLRILQTQAISKHAVDVLDTSGAVLGYRSPIFLFFEK